ncbi:putative ester cyclase [Sphingomonas sp. PP-F2F-A104-K0414]|uniref:ester cyclase n=1 Tax=Sphingomonas sp. PP-F2F-A104-K0414 TaxID=2135661 RepID=UPI001043AE5C|nr:ester cyclase [Sphingomonas sp. PP-F2F-A104-K0414]TCP97526.1 putative ester cyclase [Sphingomonas sp. PP-F2F-A104-K0414]
MNLEITYHAYLDYLNSKDLAQLERFVAENVIHNGQSVGLEGYRKMIADDQSDIPDLRFTAELLIADVSNIAARLRFDCHPKRRFRDIDVNGRRVIFHENVFYRFANGKIQEVWSVMDKAEIEKNVAAV